MYENRIIEKHCALCQEKPASAGIGFVVQGTMQKGLCLWCFDDPQRYAALLQERAAVADGVTAAERFEALFSTSQRLGLDTKETNEMLRRAGIDTDPYP